MEQYTQSNNIYNHITASLHYDQSISIHQSLEEQAFADDIRQGHVGGSIWPQKCYTCNFCDREFKSAQALGGHMNVHRRDRARLNQPLCLKTDSFSNPSDVLAYSFYSNNNNSVRIIQGGLVTNKVACMQECHVETSLNISGTRNQAAEHVGDHGGGDRYKRRRMANGSPVPFVYIACENDIDLELRLGDSTINKLT